MRETPITYRASLYEKNRREIKFDVWFGIITSIILFIIALAVFITNFVFIKVYIQGSSMYPTLKTGEVVMVNTYRAPDYGEVIVISGEKDNGDWLIKRAIAFGGDTVKIEGGYVYLKKSGETDFTKLFEPYLAEGVITPSSLRPDTTALRVWEIEEDDVFYLGDNRTNSSDSRSAFGTCNRSQVVGVVSDFAIKTKGVSTFFGNIASFINNLFA